MALSEDGAGVVRGRTAISPFELWIGVAGVYTGLSYLVPFLNLVGNANVVARQFPKLAFLWSSLYMLGGVLIVAGLIRRSPRIEGAGLNLLGSGLTVAIVAALVAGLPVRPTLVIQGGAAIACLARLFQLRNLP